MLAGHASCSLTEFFCFPSFYPAHYHIAAHGGGFTSVAMCVPLIDFSSLLERPVSQGWCALEVGWHPGLAPGLCRNAQDVSTEMLALGLSGSPNAGPVSTLPHSPELWEVLFPLWPLQAQDGKGEIPLWLVLDTPPTNVGSCHPAFTSISFPFVSGGCSCGLVTAVTDHVPYFNRTLVRGDDLEHR